MLATREDCLWATRCWDRCPPSAWVQKKGQTFLERKRRWNHESHPEASDELPRSRWTYEPFRFWTSSSLQTHFYGIRFHQVSSKGLQFDGLCRWARRKKTLENEALRVQHHRGHSEQHGRTSFNTHHDLRFFKHNSNTFSLWIFLKISIFQGDKNCEGFIFGTSWLSFGVHRSERSEPENQSCPTCQSPPAAVPRLEIFRSGRPRRRPEHLSAIWSWLDEDNPDCLG